MKRKLSKILLTIPLILSGCFYSSDIERVGKSNIKSFKLSPNPNTKMTCYHTDSAIGDLIFSNCKGVVNDDSAEYSHFEGEYFVDTTTGVFWETGEIKYFRRDSSLYLVENYFPFSLEMHLINSAPKLVSYITYDTNQDTIFEKSKFIDVSYSTNRTNVLICSLESSHKKDSLFRHTL